MRKIQLQQQVLDLNFVFLIFKCQLLNSYKSLPLLIDIFLNLLIDSIDHVRMVKRLGVQIKMYR